MISLNDITKEYDQNIQSLNIDYQKGFKQKGEEYFYDLLKVKPDFREWVKKKYPQMNSRLGRKIYLQKEILKKELSQLQEGDNVYFAYDGKFTRASKGTLEKITERAYVVRGVYDNYVEENRLFNKIGEEIVYGDIVPYYLFTAQYFLKYLSQKFKL